MDSLKSYLSIIEPRLLRHVNGKTGQFIRLLKERDFLSEAAFRKEICGEKHGASYYRELKSRAINILQALAIISVPQGSSLVKKKYDLCQKKFTVGQKFLNMGKSKEGLRLMKQAYRIAVDYDFVQFACELSSILYHNHVYYERNKRKANEYAEAMKQYLSDYVAEKNAEHHYYQVLLQNNGRTQFKVLEEAIPQISQLKGRGIKFKVYEYSLKVYYGFSTGDYHSVIQSCTEALQYFKDRKGAYSSHLQFFNSKKGIAQLAIAQYEKAAQSFAMAEPYAIRYSFNDYLLRFYTLLNCLHAGQYQRAYALYQKSKKCKYELIQLQLTIIEAYLFFLSHMGYLHLAKPFRLGKYLNNTFKAQSNKEGDNINVLIAELLVYLARDRGKFIDRVEAVNNYSYRHLTGKETRRAKRFINILCTLPRANFNPIALERKAQRHIQYLRDHPICIGEGVDIEIVPFEVLLEMILVRLGRKRA